MIQTASETPVWGDYEERLIASGRPLHEFDLSGVNNSQALTVLHTGAFVDAGENLVILGERHLGQGELARSIAANVARQGKTVRIIDGDDACLSFGENALVQLLVVNELPRQSTESARFFLSSSGDHLSQLIGERLRLRRSTIVVSSRKPLDWVRHESLGIGTHYRIAQLHMGIVVNFSDPSHQPLADRIKVPSTGGTDDAAIELYHAHSIVPTAWSRDPSMLPEHFRVTLPPRTWHWLNLLTPVLN